jgi:hypothetical protein
MTIKAGYGSDRVHLRQSSQDLVKLLGAPEKRRNSGALRQYWLYPAEHFECIVSRRSGRVLSLFFHAGNPFGESDIFAATEEKVRRMYPSKPLEGGGFRLSTGDFVGRWLSFDEGIGFHFDEKGKLRTVSVFARKHRADVKAVASCGDGHSRQIAALHA